MCVAFHAHWMCAPPFVYAANINNGIDRKIEHFVDRCCEKFHHIENLHNAHTLTRTFPFSFSFSHFHVLILIHLIVIAIHFGWIDLHEALSDLCLSRWFGRTVCSFDFIMSNLLSLILCRTIRNRQFKFSAKKSILSDSAGVVTGLFHAHPHQDDEVESFTLFQILHSRNDSESSGFFFHSLMLHRFCLSFRISFEWHSIFSNRKTFSVKQNT